jgi:hypothetical protein
MNLTRAIFLAAAFLIPAVSTVAKAEDKPAAAGEAAPAEGKKAKKAKKGKKAEEKKEGEAEKK